MSYNDDKRELLKLKQGLIEESETIHEEKRPEKYEIHGGKAKVSNFFYHYKWHVIVIAFFALVLTFLIYTTVTREQKDIRVLLTSNDRSVASSMYFKTEKIELAIEQYCPDFDKNGNIHAEVYYIDMVADEDTASYYMSNQAKFYGEISVAEAHIFIANRDLIDTEFVGSNEYSDVLVNLSELYPDDPNIIDDYFYRINGTAFADAAKYVETCPEDMYIVIRGNFDGMKALSGNELEQHERALEVFDNIIKDNKVNPVEEE